MKRFFAGLATALALVVAIIGTYIGWKQYQASIAANQAEQPNVEVCMVALSYHQESVSASSFPGGVAYYAVGHISFRLQNTSVTSVTVSSVGFLLRKGQNNFELYPSGSTSPSDLSVDEVVLGHGVSTQIERDFKGGLVAQDEWFDDPGGVSYVVSWPGGVRNGDVDLSFSSSDSSSRGGGC
ncbi:MAG TPA: hypothetical protein VEP90_22965 [Methylomirabilota bacterium]|nr:hypothetical protein [Methylomirabilota bacterium]